MSVFTGFEIRPASSLTSSMAELPNACGTYVIFMPDADKLLRSSGYSALTPHSPLSTEYDEVLYLGSTGRSLQKRIREHLLGDARRSTFRMTLGCLLKDELDLTVIGTLGQTYFHFGDDEVRLTKWMRENLAVGFRETKTPLEDEKALIELANPPLNIAGRKSDPFARELMDLRSDLSSRWIDSATGQIGGNLKGRRTAALQPPRMA